MAKNGEDTLDLIKMALNKREEDYLSPLAVLSSKCLRRGYEEGRDLSYRQDFATDADRILHSLAYTRYIVQNPGIFTFIENDHITHRVLHVQLVSKIARTIGRFLD
uniref:Uncharacterized protein n=1 Tax=uncultured Desulfobacterium sp. TaxID=201089 RepID=E1YH53_9BACT|nr:hypothetical protein N47_F15920 [uncultured Desulfobacterium sp.]